MSRYISKDIKVVLFDYDDTLVGTIAAKWPQHRYIARKWYSKELTDEDFHRHWGKPHSTFLGLLYGTDDIESIRKKVRMVQKDFPKKLHEDSLRILKELRRSGKRLGLVTSAMRYAIEPDFELLSIPKDLFDYIQTEEDTLYHKPDPRVFEPVKQWLKPQVIKSEEVVYVGDGLQDMKAALAAGFQFIGVGTGLISPKEFEDQGAKAIRTLGDLVKL